MKGKANNHKKRTLLTVFAAAAAMLSPTGAQAAERYTLSDGVRSVNVYDFSQSDAKKLIADFKRVSDKNGDEINDQNRTRYMSEKIYQDARDKGFSREESAAIGVRMANVYTAFPVPIGGNAYVLIRFNENSASPLNGATPSAGFVKATNGKSVCTIASVGDELNLSELLRKLTDIKDLNVNHLPAIYKDMYKSFISYHEKAHCLQTVPDESVADYLATLHVLNTYRHEPEAARAFIELWSGIRNHIAATKTSPDEYIVAGAYVKMALDDFYGQHHRYASEQAIWDLLGRQELPSINRAIAVDEVHFLPSLKNLERALRISLCAPSATPNPVASAQNTAPKSCLDTLG